MLTGRWKLRAGARREGSPGKGLLRTCPRGWCFRDTAALLHLHSTWSRPPFSTEGASEARPAVGSPGGPLSVLILLLLCPSPFPGHVCSPAAGLPRAHTPVYVSAEDGGRYPHPWARPSARLWAPVVWLLSVLGEPCGYSQETCLPARSRLGLAPSSITGHSHHPLGYCVSFKTTVWSCPV